MVITEQKSIEVIIDSLKDYNKIFLVGCGECSTTCKTGGKEEILKMQGLLERSGKVVVGNIIPDAPCIAAKTKAEFAKNIKLLRDAQAVLVLACGLGVQSVKDCDRLGLAVIPACNTLCGAVMDAAGNFLEKCSMCGECVLDMTCGICPVTLCPKGILNGPCGGMNKGKCEVDSDKDCAWVLIYKEFEKKNNLENFRKIQPPKNHKKSIKPRRLIMTGK